MIPVINSSYARFLKKCDERNIPIRCIFELTFRCNLRCRHCYNNDFDVQPLATMQIKDILGQLALQGVFFIIFTGGEIFTREDLFEILEHAHHKKFAMTLFTNGTLIDRKKARRLSRYNIVEVDLSIYAADVSLHERITRTKDSFQPVIDAVHFLTESKIRVLFKGVLFKDNFKEYVRIKKLAKDLSIPCLFNHIISPMRNGNKKNLRMSVSTKSISRHIAKIYKEGLSLYAKDDYIFPRGFLDKAVCTAAHSTFAIDPYGKLYPCLAAPQSAGNLCNESFGELWKNSVVLKEWRDIKLKDIEKCNKCNLVSKCIICPVNQLAENKALRAMKNVCDTAHILYKEAHKHN